MSGARRPPLPSHTSPTGGVAVDLRSRLSLLTALLAGLVIACGGGNVTPTPTATPTPAPASPTAPPAFPLTVSDQDGKPLTWTAPPKAIVSYSPGVTEILFAIGAGSQVIAADQFSDYPAEAKALKQRVKYTSPDPEGTLALNPDLVILTRAQRTSVERFRSAGLPVFYTPEPDSLDAIVESVRMWGRITGHVEQADRVASDMRIRIDAVKAKVAPVTEGPRVYYELSDSLFSVGDRTFIGSMIALLKAKNVATGSATDFPQLTAEAVISRDPQVILLADASSANQSLETLKKRPGWTSISAVKEGKVHAVDPDIGNRPGPRIVLALEEIGRLLYPDRFR
ncbi:MAG: ABC transporter substrate-binding protein [Dehalococcoidia bacterium]|nr:MAG: ABC transporter substrate-binding protein [Dehalococcoidia bacterium]